MPNPRHRDPEVGGAIQALDNAALFWNDATGRETLVMVVEKGGPGENGPSFVHTSVSGKSSITEGPLPLSPEELLTLFLRPQRPADDEG